MASRADNANVVSGAGHRRGLRAWDVLPPPRPWNPARRRRAVLLVGGITLCIAGLTYVDVRCLTVIRAWPTLADVPAVHAARTLAESLTLLILLLAVILVTDRRARIVIPHLLLSLYFGFNAAYFAKSVILRERPYATFERFPGPLGPPENASWQGFGLDFRGRARLQSFPSGHSMAVFSIAATLVWFYPRINWLIWFLAAASSASRVIELQHWPSDCLAGASIGIAAAWLSLRVRQLSTPSQWRRRKSAQPRAKT